MVGFGFLGGWVSKRRVGYNKLYYASSMICFNWSNIIRPWSNIVFWQRTIKRNTFFFYLTMMWICNVAPRACPFCWCTRQMLVRQEHQPCRNKGYPSAVTLVLPCWRCSDCALILVLSRFFFTKSMLVKPDLLSTLSKLLARQGESSRRANKESLCSLALDLEHASIRKITCTSNSLVLTPKQKAHTDNIYIHMCGAP